METRAKPVTGEPVDAHALLGRTLGGYRLDAVIGGGGMGIVFEASRTPDAAFAAPEVAAVKVLSAAFARDPDFVKRFEREADALLALEHDNLIRVLGKGEDDGLYFFVMERFAGEDLRSLMSRGPVDRALAARIIARAAAGLAHAHERGVVHRDVKPANILVRREEGDCVVKVVDFGVAQLAAPDYTLTSLTHSNLILGTVNYMSPEQRIDAANIDRRADIYALGVVAYELLTGRLPIGAFEPPSHLTRALSGAVDRVVLSALRRDPDQRPASVSLFANRLESALTPSRKWIGATAALAVAAAVAGFAIAANRRPELVKAKTEIAASTDAKSPERAPEVAVEAVFEPQYEATEAPTWAPPPELEQAADRIRRDVAFLDALGTKATKDVKSKNTKTKAALPKTTKELVRKKPAPKKKRSKRSLDTAKSAKSLALD